MFKNQVEALKNSRLTPLEKQSANFAFNVALTNSIQELAERLVEIDAFINLTKSDPGLLKINKEILPVIKAEETEITEAMTAFALVYEEVFDISA